MKISLLLPYLVVSTQLAFAQFSDDFSDGDFSSGTTWSGEDPPLFSVTNQKLKLSAPVVNGTAYLSTKSTAINSALWEFDAQLDFNPSSTNYARVYLVSDRKDLSGDVNGYFISIGSASDEISLYRQTGGVISELIDGTDNAINLSIVNVRVKVTRDTEGKWELFTDVGLTGTYSLQGSITDVAHRISHYFGVKCVYTSTRSDKFHFDNFLVSGDPFVDQDPPLWNSLLITSAKSLELSFSEPLEQYAALDVTHYLINDAVHPSVVSLSEDGTRVNIIFEEDFSNGVETELALTGITDTAMNVMSDQRKSFLYFNPVPTIYKDIVVTEIFADFSPIVGLPENEFIEIYNRSANPVQLLNWTISDGSTTGIFPSRILLPGKYLIVSNASGASALSSFGQAVIVPNFPTLNNASDVLVLKSSSGTTIDSIAYSQAWYHDDDKQQGGWTIEIIDPDNFCAGDNNWKASVADIGGTPGSINSIDNDIVDMTGPKLVSAKQTSDSTLLLQFDENLDAVFPDKSSFSIEPELSIVSVGMTSLKEISIHFADSLLEGRTYKIIAKDIKDCTGNRIEAPYHQVFLNLDSIPPFVSKVEVMSSNEIKVKFSERLNPLTSAKPENFQVKSHYPNSISLQNGDSVIVLKFENEFTNGVSEHLLVSNVEDINGNALHVTKDFLYFLSSPVQARDIIFTEIFADPTPVIGLPEAEFIELYNRSENPVSLNGWTINDLTNKARLKDMILLPGDYIIITGTSSAASYFDSLGRCMHVTGYPTLTNSGEPIVLKSDAGVTIDSVFFKLSWFRNQDKKDGGYSLELIDPSNNCKQHLNWMASESEFGGTPGFVNSVDSVIVDEDGPKVLTATLVDSVSLEVIFDDFLDEDFSSASFLFNGEEIVDSLWLLPDRNRISLKLVTSLSSKKMYEVEVNGLSDCSGNMMHPNDGRFYLNYDDLPPRLDSLIVLDKNSLRCFFNEALVDASEKSKYRHLRNDFNIESVEVDTNQKIVTLLFSNEFTNGVLDSLIISVEDINSNTSVDTVAFRFFEPKPIQRRDVIISEIFADPAPSAGLPEYEFIELYNRSENPVSLKNWYLQDASTSVLLPDFILTPGSFLVLTGSTGYNAYQTVAPSVIKLPNFPSLSNSGEKIIIRQSDSTMVDSVSYALSWYRDREKAEGGYSLELIDTENTCKQHLTWIASRAVHGGTPGFRNSVDSTIVDTEGPAILSASIVDSMSFDVTFNDFLNKDLSSVKILINGEDRLDSIFFKSASSTEIRVQVSSVLYPHKMYTVSLDSIFDCAGNIISLDNALIYFNKDFAAPKLDSIMVEDQYTLRCHFNETIAEASDVISNYRIKGKFPVAVSLRADRRSIVLHFEDKFVNGFEQYLVYTIRDINGNETTDSVKFLYFQPAVASSHDVIITEILADPAPTVGLPEYEFIELYNRSQNPVQLKDWYLTDATTTTTLPSYILLPDSYVLLTGTSGYNAYREKENVLKVSGFPSLSNGGEPLTLFTSSGTMIDLVNYSVNWYRNSEKRDGGWSLERIDVNNFCKNEANWIASRSPNGGTPGTKNSVDSVITDTSGPKLISVKTRTSTSLELRFDEPLNTAPLIDSIIFDPTVQVTSSDFLNDENKTVIVVTLLDSLDNFKEYAITLHGLADCEGNRAKDLSVIFQEDSIPPSIESITARSAHSIEIKFSERIDEAMIKDEHRYSLMNGSHPTSIESRDNNRLVILTFTSSFENGVQQEIRVSGLTDINANSQDVTGVFTYFIESPINRFDLIVTEIFSDPSPSIGLPEAEFVEILNRSKNPVDLKNLIISDGTADGQLSAVILLPDEYVILCDRSNETKFSTFGKVCGVKNFPSLNNSGDAVVLKTQSGKIIDSVQYNLNWFATSEDAEGGVALEKIDPENTCAEETNWTSSEDELGGTPGKRNSVFANKPDLTAPEITSIIPLHSDAVLMSFNEKLDTKAPEITAFTFDSEILVKDVAVNPDVKSIMLSINPPLRESIFYTLSLQKIYDCAGNEIVPVSFQLSLPEEPTPGDILINEVLFNPRSGGVDFVEIYNYSQKHVNLQHLLLSNVVNDSLLKKYAIAMEPIILKPQEYKVFTTEATILSNQYPMANKNNFVVVKNLPPMSDSEGSIAVVTDDDVIVDAFYYTDKMHSPFLKNVNGVSLERVSFHRPTTDEANWRSASKLSGYATPGYVNSNIVDDQFLNEAIKIEPEIFQPISGQPDFAAINYKFDRGGFIANVRIYDSKGREVKTLVENEILGTEGFFRWDGDRNDGAKAAIGNYLVLIEVFDESGELRRFKKRVAIAMRF